MTKRLPNFLVIGSQKAGTSTLWHVLRQHPQLFMPEKKEVNFFFHEREYSLGMDHYSAHFAEAPANALCGEASPGYICHPQVPLRIYRDLPKAKLIVTLRDPVERAYSQYWDNRRWLREPEDFDDLVRTPLHQVFVPAKQNYFSRGMYSVYLKRYFALFDPAQVLVLWFSELRQNPDALYRRCFEFLGVDPDVSLPSTTQAVNYRSVFNNPLYRFFFHRPTLAARLPWGSRRLLRFGSVLPYTPDPMSDWARCRLREYYAPYDRELAQLIGEAPPWLATPREKNRESHQ